MGDILPFLFILFLAAALLRDQFVFTVLYLFAGAYIVGRWWSGRSLKSLHFHRQFVERAFHGEDVPVKLEISNGGLLPVIWLRVQDSLPAELALTGPALLGTGSFKRVISLGPRSSVAFEYTVKARKRGYYQIGPLAAASGDVFGMGRENHMQGPSNFLTVYPRTYILSNFRLPSRSPMGTLRHNQPMFEDPTRVLSKRDYQSGDSLRRVDWKATAAIGRLQVKQFEPSIALETAIFLNLNADEYDVRVRFDSTELAIVIAASLANWVASNKQSIGLHTNGLDPHPPSAAPNRLASIHPQTSPSPEEEKATTAQGTARPGAAQRERFQPVPLRKGQGHLMRVLDVLARVESTPTISFTELLQREAVYLSWGVTVVLITGKAEDDLFDEIFRLRRRGLDVVLILAGRVANVQQAKERAELFNIPFFHIRNELDMDMWRK